MNTTPSPPDLDAASAAALIDTERSRASGRERRLTAGIIITWGIVWLVGYIAVWSGPTGGNPWFTLPGGLAWGLLAGLVAAGVAVSAVLGISMGKETRGPTNRIGATYGISFGIGTAAIMLFDLGLVRAGMSQDVASLLFPGSFLLIIAAMYMAGSTSGPTPNIDVAQFVTGVALLAVTVIATFVGTPHHWLVYAMAGLVFFVGAFAFLKQRG